MSLPFLETIGLTTNEANLYELLLRLGEVPANTIIAQTSLPRATVYKSLYSLEQKGLLIKYDKGKIIHFKPEPPTKLLELADTQYRQLERAKKDVQALIPQMTSSYILSVERPVVTTFEGVEGLKQIYEDMLRVGKPIYAVLQAHEVEEGIYAWLTGPFVRKRIKLGIPVQAIVSASKHAEVYAQKDEKEFRTTRIVSNDLFPFQHELDIYGSKVAFIHFKRGERLVGVVVDHPQIAQTMKALFDLAWEGAAIKNKIG